MFRITTRFVLVLAVSVAAVAQEPAVEKVADAKDSATKKQADVSGTWKWERTLRDNRMVFTLRISRQQNGKLAGSYAVKRNERTPEPTKIEDVKLNGDKLTFRVHRTWNDREFTIDYEGAVSDESIKGLTRMDFGGNSRESEWVAKRVVDAADVIGTWQLRFERNGNVMEPTLKIAGDGDELKGVLIGPRGERELKQVQIKENQLAFKMEFERNGNSITVNYIGSPRGDTMQGTIESSFGGESRSTKIDGRRIPERKAEQDEEK